MAGETEKAFLRQFPPAKAQNCYEKIINVKLRNWFDREVLSCQAEHGKGGVSFSGFGLKAKIRNSVLDSLDWWSSEVL